MSYRELEKELKKHSTIDLMKAKMHDMEYAGGSIEREYPPDTSAMVVDDILSKRKGKKK